MQLLLVQRAAGGLTIGDTHVYDEPFDFAVEEHLYDELRPGPRRVLGLAAAPGGPALGRRLHRGHRRPHLLPVQPRPRGRGGDRAGRAGHDPVAGHRRGDLGGTDPMTTPIRLAALDMAGTTVADDGAVEEAFQAALDAVGLVAGDLMDDPGAYIRRTMGQSKITVFTELLGGDRHRAEQANAAFEAAFDQAVDRGEVAALPGSVEAFAALRDGGVRICLTTGFSPATRDRIVGRSGWRGLVDLALSPADAGRGRPWPDMILTAVLRLRIDDVAEVAVAGDTTSRPGRRHPVGGLGRGRGAHRGPHPGRAGRGAPHPPARTRSPTCPALVLG